ncbi:MAG TPA: PDZ domain-containing protein [Povalibacter sp.]|nr:PDZ domain-containing protein [Povalibacter sp.]
MTVKAKFGSAVAMVLMGALLSANASAAADDAAKDHSRAETRKKLEEAQKRLDAAAREVANLSMSMSEDVVPPHFMTFAGPPGNRAVLGLNIGSPRNDSRDDGVEVISVSPGGGAAEAGLKAGDVLTEVNGTALRRSAEKSPRGQLLSAMNDVEPGTKVTVKYLRDGKTATATIVTRQAPDRFFGVTMPGPQTLARLPGFAFARADGVFGATEFVSLTPKLGQYFGTDKGLLVVRAPEDARLKLEEGDVVVDIDGRVPSSPSHALQILASYQSGEKLKLNVLRMKKQLTFDIVVPKDESDPRLRSGWQRTHPPSAVAPAIPLPPPEAGRRQTVIAPGSDEPI